MQACACFCVFVVTIADRESLKVETVVCKSDYKAGSLVLALMDGASSRCLLKQFAMHNHGKHQMLQRVRLPRDNR